MWVSTSFSSALNFLPHHVRSAFQLSIWPPSIRMKRKFPCSAQGGTSCDLARYSFSAGSKECAEQSTRQALTRPISRMTLTIRTSCMVFFPRNAHEQIADSAQSPNGRNSRSLHPFDAPYLRTGRVRLHHPGSVQPQSPDKNAY